MMDNKQDFKDWFSDGNVVKFKNGYSTQCSQYKNRYKTIKHLYKYFLTEFK